MSTYTADQIIGKTLVAKKDTTGYYGSPLSDKTFKIFAGQNVGKVYSYVQKTSPDGKLYWMFYDSANKPYYVQHNDAISMNMVDSAMTKTQEEIIKEKKEQQEKEEKGAILYYGEKVGKNLLLLAGVALLGKYVIMPSITKNN